MNLQEMNCPGFFKFFVSERCTEQLAFPRAFTRCIKGDLPEKVVLRDRYNSVWQVSVNKSEDKYFFRGGWVNYVKHNLVIDGEMLVFEYVLHGLFNVKLFDLSAREKIGAGRFIFKGIECHEDMATDHDEDNNEEDDDHAELEENQNKDEESKRNEEDEEKESKENEEDIAEDIADVDKEDDEDSGEEEEEEDFINGDSDEGVSNVETRQKKRVTDIYGVDIFRGGLAVRPKNPYFVWKISKKRPSELYVPAEFVKHSGVDFTKVTDVVDPLGNTRPLKYKKWTCGRVYYAGGWRKLCERNLVTTEDTCICEFVKDNHGSYIIKVNFVRAN